MQQTPNEIRHHGEMTRSTGLITTAVWALSTASVAFAQIFAQQGFTDTAVASVPAPTAIAFLPDGRMLVTSQSGVLRVFSGTTGVVALTIPATSICSNSERGLLGVAVDPEFPANGYVYLYYTFRTAGSNCGSRTNPMPRNRVSRFRMQANTVDAGSEFVLIDNIPSWNGNHNAGDLQFGNDGLLYISAGDSGCDPYPNGGCAGANDAARDPHTLLGKILRIDRDGNIPPTNPYTGAGSQRCNTANAPDGVRCQETYASGLRNPFRIAFDRESGSTNRFFILDVGQNVWEEIDLGIAGADYGWNTREGACANGSRTNCPPTPANFTDPIFSYPHGVTVPGTQSSGCDSIAGGAFVPRGGFGPADFDGSFLFADYVCGSIFRLVPNPSNNTWRVADFVRALGGNSAVHLTFGPFNGGQALYYTTYAGGGQIRRIVYADGRPNATPTAVLSANRTSGLAPLTVQFSAAGSADPDASDTLNYLWDFGDPSSPGTVTTSTPTAQHTYNANGIYTVTLRVRDQRNAVSEPATLRIFAGNTPPVPTIQSPGVSDRFTVGQSITLAGSATDAEDAVLPSSALTWTVILHHGSHTHPFLGPIAGNAGEAGLTFTAPAPEDLIATENSYLEIVLQARDSAGEGVTMRREFRPILVPVQFETNPTGMLIRVNGLTLSTPLKLTSWAGYALDFTAPDQDMEDKRYIFRSWSNGQPRSQRLVTPATSPDVLRAEFEAVPGPGNGNTDIRVVEAASFSADAIAPASLATILSTNGLRFTEETAIHQAEGQWPMELAGVRVRISDSAGIPYDARLYVAAPDVITLEVPAELGTGGGTALVEVFRGEARIAHGQTVLDSAAPGIFTTTGDGRGIARSSTRSAPEGNPPGSLLLSVQATGIRRASELHASLGGIEVAVLGVTPAGFPGLDEIEILVPAALVARGGDLPLTVSADRKPANLVTVRLP